MVEITNLKALHLFTDSQFPSLSWLLSDISSGSGVDLCPLVGVSKPVITGDSEALVMSRDQEAVYYLCSYMDRDGNSVVNQVIYPRNPKSHKKYPTCCWFWRWGMDRIISVNYCRWS